MKALNLSAVEREIVVLRLTGYTYKEIALIRGTTIISVVNAIERIGGKVHEN